jgi:2-phosphosulfolactate phosphatase
MSRRVHVLMKKEELDAERLPGKVVIVLDVLFATTTIAAALAAGAAEVVPALDADSARSAAKGRAAESYVLSGELRAETISGFAHPTPLALTRHAPLAGKTLIYSTTNGTVALAKSVSASQVYAAALVNARAVVDHVQDQHPGDTVLLVCAGSMENFNLEDFYGAGHLARLFADTGATDLSDAALAARKLHAGTRALECLRESRVGRMMLERGLDAEIDYAANADSLAVVPRLEAGRLIAAERA